MLDLDALDAEFSRIVQSANGSTSVATDLAKAYDDYAKGAIIKGATCSAGGSKVLLESAFTTDNTPATSLNMATKLCTYWQGLPKLGIPTHGGVIVVSVVPSFQVLFSAVYASITSCIATTLFETPYKRLFKTIEMALKTAPVSITETMPNGSPSAFMEYLS